MVAAAGAAPGTRCARLGQRLLPVLPTMLRSARGRQLVLGGSVAHPERVPPEAATRLVSSYLTSDGYESANSAMRAAVFSGFEDIRVPVTLAWGDLDRIVRKPRETLPEWRTIMLHGCGHIPTWDDPGQVARDAAAGEHLDAPAGIMRSMGVAPPPAVPTGVLSRIQSDLRSQRAARGGWPPGELSFSLRRTREFESEPLPLLLEMYEEYGPVFALRLLYLPVVFALGPEANHYITVSHASNFRWRDGSMGDLIPLLGDGLLTTDGDYHRRARRIMLPAFHREQLVESTSIMVEEARACARATGGPDARLDLYAWTRRLALRVAMRALFGFDPDRGGRDGRMAEEFEETLGYWGKDYVVQMLRGPGSPWRAMNRSRAHARPGDLRRDRPRGGRAESAGWTSCRCCWTPRTRTARGCRTRSCATR